MDDLSDELKNEIANELADEISSDDAVIIPGDGSDEASKKQPETLSSDIFTIKISEEMALRNALRTGLVEAQGKDTEKMPMFVSWPGWLDDGIVCMFSKDFRELLDRTVKAAAESFSETIGTERKTAADSDLPVVEAEGSEYEPVSFPELDENT